MLHLLRSFRKYSIVAVLALTSSSLGLANRVQAQTYQIDCAILLCLSGGWPASVPCARARAEFIRRITPWPIEPPLQIWRCPMGASYDPVTPSDNRGRFYDILFSSQNRPRPLLSPTTEPLPSESAVLNFAGPKPSLLPEGLPLQLVQGRPDIDISGPEFNFVRSIRVYDVLIDDDRDDEDCDRYSRVRIGTYDTQGGFSWHRSNRSAIPTAFGRTSHGCSLFARAVFVEWRDYVGNYGFERVDY